MTRAQYIDHLLNILSYDSMIEVLCIAERYWLHREIIANCINVYKSAVVTETPLGHIINLSDKIKQTQWVRPELRYNSFRELEEYRDYAWQPFNIHNHI